MIVRSVLTLAAAGLLLAGCFSSTDAAQPAPAASKAVTAKQQAFVDAVEKIHPGLDSQPKYTITDGENTCQEIRAGKDEATVLANAVKRFEVTEAEARQIVAAARATICA